MDGNGRWAQARGLPRSAGHRAGARSVTRVVEACAELKIPFLTLYAFSTENWHRPPAEVNELMNLLVRFLRDRERDLHRYKLRLTTIGQIERLPANVQAALQRVVDATAHYTAGTLTLALSYGARDEILAAVRQATADVVAGRLRPEEIDEARFSQYLDTRDMPDPDLIIRTSGEMRLSNFLLWQASYAEFFVTPTLWPDFGREEFRKALLHYSQRDRRFGGLQNA
jgi:undecaprenyl diphosphate synthase